MADRKLPTDADVRSWIRDRSNWGRWGKDDQLGALNLVTPAKRVAATRVVRNGRSVSLSRPFPKEPGPNNAYPAQHYMRTVPRGKGGFAADYYGIFYHGIASTTSTRSAIPGTRAGCGTGVIPRRKSRSRALPSAGSSTGARASSHAA